MSEQLLQLKTIILNPSADEDTFVRSVGSYIDLASKFNINEEVRFAINLLETRKNSIASENNKCLLHYFLAVAYSDVYKNTITQTDKDWDWEQELVEKELKNLRLAYQFASPEIDDQITSNILINLSNRLDSLGRFILSFDFWNKALEHSSFLGMVAVNLANSLMYYGLNYINDKKYQVVFIQLAHQYFTNGLRKPLFPGVESQVKERLIAIEKNYKEILDYRFYKEDLIIDYENEKYSEWCTKKSLWLNPISNLNPKIDCNKDDLKFIHSNIEFVDFFETIKRDYIFCRRQFFDSLAAADNDEAENLKKSSFKNAYSIFDKITYLLSGVLELEDTNSSRLSYNRIWYTKLEKSKGIRALLIEKRNLMLRALYWVSKDIYLNEYGFQNIIEPNAKEINTIRNYMEHKSFKFGTRFEQGFSLQMPVEEFDANTLKLLKLVRECLIYSAYYV